LEFAFHPEINRPRGIYLLPYQQLGGLDEDQHRESNGPVTLRVRGAIVGSTGSVSTLVALSTDAAPDLKSVSVPVTIQGERIIFSQERYRSA
jgi:hypothetical protein